MFCYSFVVTVLDIMQEDKPRIVITAPASKRGKVNRGYMDLSGLHGNLFNNDEFSNLIAKTSQMSFHPRFDIMPPVDSQNLAAKGHIATQKAALSHLQVPSIDGVSVSSAESIYDSDHGETSMLNKKPVPNSTVANGVRTGNRYEENNNVRVQNGNGSLTNGIHSGNRHLQMAAPSAFYSTASSSRSPSSNSDFYGREFVPSQKPLRNTRTKRPMLRRQDATDSDTVELKLIETKNQNDESLSLQISPL